MVWWIGSTFVGEEMVVSENGQYLDIYLYKFLWVCQIHEGKETILAFLKGFAAQKICMRKTVGSHYL